MTSELCYYTSFNSQLCVCVCVCVCVLCDSVCVCGVPSGVAKLGHTGARALATRGCAPPVQALSVPNVNRELVHKGVEIELRSIAIWNNEVSYAPLISVYACLL